jgi:hypothetical protein
MGLFSINMPLLYGDGQNAFRRLQLEILNQTDDESIFALGQTLWHSNVKLGLLAILCMRLENPFDV